ncbi:MAG: S-adenosylmethionine decarboxylase proenzyme [Myxococcaceae bacterium]
MRDLPDGAPGEGLATHVLVDCWGVEPALLDDPARLEDVLTRAARAARCEILSAARHHFTPQGVTLVLLLAESHLAIHTWPEAGFALVDLLTCGRTLPKEGVAAVISGLNPQRSEVRFVDRGLAQPR